MAWGLWNKIKNGITKAGRFIKNAAKVVTDKVVKPFKPVIAGAIGAVNPVAGAAAHAVMNSVERFSDEGWSDTGKRAVGWASSKLNR